jgi:aminoglycoside phosphotransferase (APT) family kinase protein
MTSWSSPGAVLARLQRQLVDRLPALRAAGLPDRTLQPTRAGLEAVVGDSVELPQLTADERAEATAMLPWLLDRLDTFADLGIPYSVAHGDLHLGNVAGHASAITLYDWTDAAAGFPFLDAVHLAASTRSDPAVGPRVLAAYSDVWSEGYDCADVEQMLGQAPLVNRIYQMISYEGIYRSREPDSLWEMRGIVALSLRQLIEQWHLSGASAG